MFTCKHLTTLAVGAAFTAFSTDITLAASSFNPAPLYDSSASFSTVIESNGDETDIYYPILNDGTPVDDLPIALFLQGALVDKLYYSDYANQVARYGFVIVVPNHERSIPDLGNVLLPEISQIEAVLAALDRENADPLSPLAGQIDTGKLGLLGHSFGAAVGLSAIANKCLPLLCLESFERPSELMGGAFFGANLRDQADKPIPIPNHGIGVALLQGDQDGRALPLNAQATFDNIAAPPKALVTLKDVNHFGVTNVNTPSGAIPDPNQQALDQDLGIETVARWSGLFLRGTVLDDEQALNYVLNTGKRLDPNVSFVAAKAVDEPSGLAGSLSWGIVLGCWGLRRQLSC